MLKTSRASEAAPKAPGLFAARRAVGCCPRQHGADRDGREATLRGWPCSLAGSGLSLKGFGQFYAGPRPGTGAWVGRAGKRRRLRAKGRAGAAAGPARLRLGRGGRRGRGGRENGAGGEGQRGRQPPGEAPTGRIPPTRPFADQRRVGTEQRMREARLPLKFLTWATRWRTVPWAERGGVGVGRDPHVGGVCGTPGGGVCPRLRRRSLQPGGVEIFTAGTSILVEARGAAGAPVGGGLGHRGPWTWGRGG